MVTDRTLEADNETKSFKKHVFLENCSIFVCVMFHERLIMDKENE